jgi:hypothetical protein
VSLLVQSTRYREPRPRTSEIEITGVLQKARTWPGQPTEHWINCLSDGALRWLAAEAIELMLTAESPGAEQ